MEFFRFLHIFILKIFYDWGEITITAIGLVISILGYLKPLDNPDDSDNDKLRKQKLRRKTLIKTLGMTLALVVGVFLIKMYYIYVPDINLGEESLQQVSSQIIDADLGYSDDNLKADEKTKDHLKKKQDLMNHALKVIDCEPKPRNFVRKGKDIFLTVYWDDKPDIDDLDDFLIKKAILEEKERNFPFKVNYKKVPDVKGLSLDEAKNALKKEEILYQEGNPIYSDISDTIEAGKILSQNPEAGAIVDENTKVVLVVSKGVEPVEMPDVLNMPEEKAKSDLEKLGLKVTKKEGYSNTAAEGNVSCQSRNAGESLMPGEKVEITISIGAKPEENKPEQAPTRRISGTSDTDSHSQGTPGGQEEQDQETGQEDPPQDTVGGTQTAESEEASSSVPTEIIDDPDTSEIPGENVK